MAWEDDFLYPLYLLLIGSGVLSVVVSLLTHFLERRREKQQNELEDRRRKQQNELEDLRKKREIEVVRERIELEIKVDLASKVAEVVADRLINAFLAVDRKQKDFDHSKIEEFYDNVKKYYIDINIISSKLGCYFYDPSLAERWDNFSSALLSYATAARQYFYDPPNLKQKEDLKANLEKVREYLSDNNQVNDNERRDLDRLITEEPTYDKELWDNVTELLTQRGREILKDIMELPIKAL